MSWPSFWIHNNWQTKILGPLSKLVCWEAQRRYNRYLTAKSTSTQPRQSEATVIVVGNLVVGGTGKTPFIVWLVDQLKNQGFKVAILSRGYGVKKVRSPIIVDACSNPSDAGDEPVMLAQQTGCTVVVFPKRSEAIEKLQKMDEFDFIISDDGLQHFALQRDIEVVMIDAERQFGNGFCLPAGPLREPLTRLQDVDFTVWNGLSKKAPIPRFEQIQRAPYRMQLNPKRFHSLVNPGKSLSPDEFFTKYKEQGLYAIAGIGNPERFFNTLIDLGFKLKTQAFSDHYDYEVNDFDDLLKDGIKPLVMTQKDAVKCSLFVKPHQDWWYLEVATECSAQIVESVVGFHQQRQALK